MRHTKDTAPSKGLFTTYGEVGLKKKMALTGDGPYYIMEQSIQKKMCRPQDWSQYKRGP